MVSLEFACTRPSIFRDPNAHQSFVCAMGRPSSAGDKRRNLSSHTSPRQTTQGSEKEKTLHHEQRRRAFLNKVRQKGEDKKWDIRGEQILREDFLNTERDWIDSQNRSAPPLVYPEDDDMMGTVSDGEQQANTMIDQVLSQENEEVDALISLLEERTDTAGHEPHKRVDYGSDDENYDSIFLNLLSSTSTEGPSIPDARHISPEMNNEALTSEAMDTSGG
ncbi:MAG: hypothetical protein Q9172_000941 [Xanthocarpia lactea]